VVIFDEAHNIEDVSREAATLELQRAVLAETHGALAKAASFNGRPEVYGPLREAAASLLRWLEEKEKAALEVRAGFRLAGVQRSPWCGSPPRGVPTPLPCCPPPPPMVPARR
jgi:Rad3-related DNA helicase